MMRRLLRQRLPLIALLLASFLLVPVLDSVLCASDSLPSHALSQVSPADGDKPDTADSPRHADDSCSHGHCHHSSTHVPPGTLAVISSRLISTSLPDRQHFASRTLDGLIRPPRA